MTLSDEESTGIAMSLTKLNFEVALQSEKLFQIKNSIGEANIFKSVCALLKMFSDAAKVNKPLSSSEIIMCTDWIIKKYTHESLADFALALKDGIFGGHKFYGSVTVSDVKEVMEKYFESKAERLEEMSRIVKTPETPIEGVDFSKMIQEFTPDYSVEQESYMEVIRRLQVEKVSEDLKKYREKLESIRIAEVKMYEYELIDKTQNEEI